MIIREDLRRWFKEKWVDISRKKDGKHPPCGRSKAKDSKYPKCRPSVRVSSKTPETSGEMTQKEKKSAVRQKRSAEAKVSTTGKGRKPVMTSHLKENINEMVKKSINFVKTLKEQSEITDKFTCSYDKNIVEEINSSCLNKKVIAQYFNEDKIKYAKGLIKPASNNNLKEGYDLEIIDNNSIIPLKIDTIVSLKYFDSGKINEYKILSESKNKPTNPSLWSRAKSLAKKKFKVYPSAYANGWASKWYKKNGGGWKSVNEDVQLSVENLTKTQKQKMNQVVDAFIREEIVNAKHAGTMTKKEIKSRDKTAKKVKAKPIKGKDTEENAKYRLATYIELKKRGQEPKGKKKKK